MPNQRLLMRQIREVLRHKYALGLFEREIGRALGLSKSGVGDAIRRARSCPATPIMVSSASFVAWNHGEGDPVWTRYGMAAYPRPSILRI